MSAEISVLASAAAVLAGATGRALAQRRRATGTAREAGEQPGQPRPRAARPRRRPAPTAVIAALAWPLLLLGAVALDLWSRLAGSPSWPTLSTMIGHVTNHRSGRGLLFAFWELIGLALAFAAPSVGRGARRTGPGPGTPATEAAGDDPDVTAGAPR